MNRPAPTNRTEDDLRGALGLLERLADETCDHAAAAPVIPLERPGRRRAMAASAAAVAAVAVGALVVSALSRPHDGPAGPAAGPPLTQGYATLPTGHLVFDVAGAADPAGWALSSDSQSLTVGAATVTVYSTAALRQPHEAAYDPAGAEPVQVDGAPGVYAGIYDYAYDGNDSHEGIAWQYAPGAWATVAELGGGDLSRDAALALAERVEFDATRTVTTPLAFAAGLGATTGGWHATPGASEALYSIELDGAQNVLDWTAGRAALHKTSHEITVAGHPAYVTERMPGLSIDGGTWVLNISTGTELASDPQLSTAQLTALAEQITVAPDHWFDAETALP